ncbi:MAG: sulfatase [Acidobacteria bacterium]|nr:sulfatase [Acidobacteriota bacterium]
MVARREFLTGLAGAALAGCEPEKSRPNVVVLMPDQFRGMDLSVMGNPDVQTPNMDNLASQGVLIENTFANCPVCCPARGTLLTGRYAHAHGVAANDAPLPSNEVTIAEILKEHGYRTGFVGKWHLEGGKRLPGFVPPGPRRQGFDYWAANICSHNYWDMEFFRDEPTPIAMPGYSAETFTDEAIKFLAQESQQPFCLYLQWGPPHNPYVAPPEYMNLYDLDALTMRGNWKPETPLNSRIDIAGYYSAITFIDHEVGRILKVLEEQGLAENTIVLLTSDHGDMLGSHGHSLKRKPWEESIRIPGILRYPAVIEAGQTASFPLSHVDMVPTLLGLAGLPPKPNMQGHNCTSLLTGATEGEPESAYLQSYTPTEGNEFPPWRGVRTTRYTYARHEDRPWLLYDNEDDPFQMQNLIGLAEHRNLEAELDSLTKSWFEDTQDSWIERKDLPYR